MENSCTICNDAITEGYMNICLHSVCSECVKDINKTNEIPLCECGEPIDATSLIQKHSLSVEGSKQDSPDDASDHATRSIPLMIDELEAQIHGNISQNRNCHSIGYLLKTLKAKTKRVKETYDNHKKALQEYYGLSQDNVAFLDQLRFRMDAEYKEYELQVEKLEHLLGDVRTIRDHLAILRECFQKDVFTIVNKRYDAFFDTVDVNNLRPVIDLVEKDLYETSDGHLYREKIRGLQVLKNKFEVTEPKFGESCVHRSIIGRRICDNVGGLPVNAIFTMHSLEDDILTMNNSYKTLYIYKLTTKELLSTCKMVNNDEEHFIVNIVPFYDKVSGKFIFLQTSKIYPVFYYNRESTSRRHCNKCGGPCTNLYWKLMSYGPDENNMATINWTMEYGCFSTAPQNPSRLPHIDALARYNEEQIITFSTTEKKLFFINVFNGEVKRIIHTPGVEIGNVLSNVKICYVPRKETIVVFVVSKLHFINMDGYLIHTIGITLPRDKYSHMSLVDGRFIVLEVDRGDTYSVEMV